MSDTKIASADGLSICSRQVWGGVPIIGCTRLDDESFTFQVFPGDWTLRKALEAFERQGAGRGRDE